MMAESRYFPGGQDRAEYAAACGRIRVLEKRLLNRTRLAELAAAPDLDETFLLLRRWGWVGNESVPEPWEWDHPLTKALKASDRELLAIDPGPLVTALLIVRYDLLNLSAVLRARGEGRSFDGPLHPRGTSGLPALEAMAAGLDFSPYPAPLAGELERRRELLASTEARRIADAVTQAHHHALKKAAHMEESRLLADYLDHAADLENIKMALRSLIFPELWERKVPLLPAGRVDGELLMRFRSTEELVKGMKGTVYGALIAGCRTAGGEISLTAFERACDNFSGSLMEPARYVSLGPEPLWAYWQARERDAKNIRIRLLGLRNGTEEKVLREAFRETHG